MTSTVHEGTFRVCPLSRQLIFLSPEPMLHLLIIKFILPFVLLILGANALCPDMESGPSQWFCIPCGGIYECQATFAPSDFCQTTTVPGCNLPLAATSWMCCRECSVQGTGICEYDAPAPAPGPFPPPPYPGPPSNNNSFHCGIGCILGIAAGVTVLIGVIAVIVMVIIRPQRPSSERDYSRLSAQPERAQNYGTQS